ncbi:MAG: exodeoxyribonuclease VII large subunit, partial [Chloroflexi bacterium]|nr:exodeoxyribonuclease VII large subunit [Chloroflexota bacterium]
MPVYSVSQVTSYLNELLARDELLQDIWVSGEVANLARPGSGHAYFTLRDGQSSMRCVMFRRSRGIERLDDGVAVIAHGRASVYEVRGDLQLIVDIVQPEGVGELQLRLEQLKLKLENEGLFEPSRKRSLPEFPKRVGVITSPTGAVWQDIQTVINRRYPLVELLLAPTLVQGSDAAPRIVEAFQAMNQVSDIDVVLLARGGGSLEDLWPFNEEAVARAVYASRAPVVSAIGHETDFTIADLVADQRAPTPSAAAEMAVPDRLELTSHVFVAEQALSASISGRLSIKSDSLRQIEARLQRSLPDLDSLRMRIDDLLRSAATHIKHNLEVKAERLKGLKSRLESLSPSDTLRRGYAIVQTSANGKVVSDASQIDVGDSIQITLGRGAIEAQTTSVKADDDDRAK